MLQRSIVCAKRDSNNTKKQKKIRQIRMNVSAAQSTTVYTSSSKQHIYLYIYIRYTQNTDNIAESCVRFERCAVHSVMMSVS